MKHLLVILLLATSAAQAQSASVDFSSQASQGAWVTVDHVSLPAGGFVAIHDQQGPGAGNVLGASGYLEAGNHSFVPVQLASLNDTATVFAVLHEDDGDQQFGYESSNGQADQPFTEDGQVVAVPAQVEPGEVATVTFEDQELDDELVVAHVFLPSGGFVAIHRESFLDEEYFSSTISTSQHLAPGNHTNVTVQVDVDGGGFLLAVAHRDSDGDGVYDFDIDQGESDPFYLDGSLAAMDRAAVRLPGDTGNGGTVGAGQDEPDGNDTPAPGAIVVLLAIALALRRK